MSQVAARGCQDLLGNGDRSHETGAWGTKEGVVGGQRWSCIGQERREECSQFQEPPCKDLDMGREQEDRKKLPVAAVSRAVRTVG